MCRMFGAVATEPISARYELLESSNPLIGQSEIHDSGWGIAAYREIGGEAPQLERFAVAAHSDKRFAAATDLQGRIFNVHVRRATFGGLSTENTHPFEFGPYSFSHNGTVLNYRSLLRRGMAEPCGETDSECLFLRLMNEYNPNDPVRSMRGVIASVVASTTFSGLNFLFSDGLKLYAYRLGVFSLYWAVRPGVAMVASERLTNETWHCVQQDVLLTLDPEHPEEPKAERLIGGMLLASAQIQPLEPDPSLLGAERGEFAARRALREAGQWAGRDSRLAAIDTGFDSAEPA
ncbi:MAG: class II glutamine amidotransferase [Thermoleophilia bacterium]|nr:class II glutamine amidotransferase [Thermoleophilia bacterium]